MTFDELRPGDVIDVDAPTGEWLVLRTSRSGDHAIVAWMSLRHGTVVEGGYPARREIYPDWRPLVVA